MSNEHNEILERVPVLPLGEIQAEYERLYPDVFEIYGEAGIHPDKQPHQMQDIYTGEVREWDYGNVGNHSIGVAYNAEQIMKALGRDHIPEDCFHFVMRRVLLHDANKLPEKMREKAQKDGIISADEDIYSTWFYEDTFERLKRIGISGASARAMAYCGQENGHQNMHKFVSLYPMGAVTLNWSERSLADFIIHLADDINYTPYPNPEKIGYCVTTAEYIKLAESVKNYPVIAREGFGFKLGGTVCHVKDVADEGEREGLFYVKPFVEWQSLIARMICQHLQQRIDLSNKQDSELFICDLVNKGL